MLMNATRITVCAVVATLCTVLLRDASASAGPAEDYIDAQLRVVRGLEKRVDSITGFADEAAGRLLAGGNVYLAGEPGMVAELLGRAGGLCSAKVLDLSRLPKLDRNDLVLYSDYGLSGEWAAQRWKRLVASRALVIAFASAENPILQNRLPANVRAIPVDIPRDSRLVTEASGERLIPAAPPAIAIAEWTFTAELIGACRRRHRQLAVYLSIFLDEGHRRLKRTQGMLFEPDLRPPTAASGELAREFLAAVKSSLTVIRTSEMGPIRRAAVWLREASAAKRQVIRNFQGHLPPKEAGRPGDVRFFSTVAHGTGAEGVAWIHGHLHAGDVYLFLGYQHNEDAMAAAASFLGARTIFLTSRRPGPRIAADPLHIDVDPHWPLTDACLALPGYDVKACPLSAIAGLSCYYAICAEAIRR